MKRLHPSTLPTLPADVRRPAFDRSALRGGIVHLGVGAFARAHLAVMNDDAIEAGAGADISARHDTLAWGIRGVSLRQPATRDALTPQGGLYTVAVRDGSGSRLRVIGSLLDCIVAPENPAAVLDLIAHHDTRIVSLTITEKAYGLDPASGLLQHEHPDIRHDMQAASAPRSAVGFIVRGLASRHARGVGPLTLMSLDNLPANGNALRRLVLDFAQIIDPKLAAWTAANCTFPNSMVDRIVPRTTDADRTLVAASLGLDDAWPVFTEPFFDWAVEDRFAAGRPDWAAAGARIVSDVTAWETLKLRMVNGSHSAIAYLGLMAGWQTVDVAMAKPALRGFIDGLMHEEVEPTLAALTGIADLDVGHYRQQLLQRFANPALAHQTRQIAMDGSQKLPQRLLGTLRDRLSAGQPIARLTLAVAAWLHHLRGVDEAGVAYAIDDPLAAPLQALWQQVSALPNAQARADRLTRYTPVFGDLAGVPALVTPLAAALASLRLRGVEATLNEIGKTASDTASDTAGEAAGERVFHG